MDRNLDSCLVRQCAPTLAGHKLGNLFCVDVADGVLLCNILARWNQALNPKGVIARVIAERCGRYFIYVYRNSALQNLGCSCEVRNFLKGFGYVGFDAESLLNFFQKRMTRSVCFPHEVGVFLGYPLQDVNHQLFTESVLEEILLGMNPSDENAALEILDGLNLKQYAEEHPMSLSGGQKQRVAVASGISSGCEIVVFDEPTSGLDYRQMLAVSATLKKLAEQGKTLLVITHDPEFILNSCQSVVRMEHGRIAEQFPLQGNEKRLIKTMVE